MSNGGSECHNSDRHRHLSDLHGVNSTCGTVQPADLPPTPHISSTTLPQAAAKSYGIVDQHKLHTKPKGDIAASTDLSLEISPATVDINSAKVVVHTVNNTAPTVQAPNLTATVEVNPILAPKSMIH